MADITRERAGEIVRAAFGVLRHHPDGMQVRKLIDEVKARLPLTDYEQGSYENTPGVQRFDKIIRFSTIQSVKAGWLTKSKGVWTVTEEGHAAYAKFTDPGDFMRESYRLYAAWKKAQPNEDGADPEGVEEVTASATLEEADESAWGEIAQHLRQMSPYDFQDLVAALLGGMGYHVSWVSPPGKDRGVDILAYTDPLGAEGPRIKVQVKRRNDTKTTVDDLRSFMAVLSAQDVGLYVASGGFTSDAIAEARYQENRRITLVDLQALFDLCGPLLRQHAGLRPAAAPPQARLVPLGRRLMRRPDIDAGARGSVGPQVQPQTRSTTSAIGDSGLWEQQARPVPSTPQATWSLGHTYRSWEIGPGRSVLLLGERGLQDMALRALGRARHPRAATHRGHRRPRRHRRATPENWRPRPLPPRPVPVSQPAGPQGDGPQRSPTHRQRTGDAARHR